MFCKGGKLSYRVILVSKIKLLIYIEVWIWRNILKNYGRNVMISKEKVLM